MDLEDRYTEIAVSPCTVVVLVLYCNHCSHFVRSASLARAFQYSILSERRVTISHEPTRTGSWVFDRDHLDAHAWCTFGTSKETDRTAEHRTPQ
jgi:hypothetical protein